MVLGTSHEGTSRGKLVECTCRKNFSPHVPTLMDGKLQCIKSNHIHGMVYNLAFVKRYFLGFVVHLDYNQFFPRHCLIRLLICDITDGEHVKKKRGTLRRSFV